MNIRMMKFGGTSVGNVEQIRKVAAYVIQAAKKDRVVVVVSAMADTTSRLKILVREICLGKPPAQERDQVLATGEVISAALLVMAIKDQGGEAVSLSGHQIGIETEERHGEARIRGLRGLDRIKQALAQGKIVVVAGFQGVVKEKDVIATLGTGGSDVTTVALAVGLKTGQCEIYKEFDGIYTADPRLVPQAKRFDRVSHHQVLQLTGAGAEVVMSRAVLLAYNRGVEIKVLLSPSIGKSSGGTLVCSGSTDEDMEGTTWTQAGLVVKRKALINISHLPNRPNVMGKLEDAIDGITIGPAMQSGAGKRAIISYLCSPEDLLTSVSNLRRTKLGRVEGSEVAALTVVHPLPETANCRARCARVLGKVGINIVALSENGPIMVVVNWRFLKKAAGALAKEFDLLS